jgi:hypothetical protein
MQTRNRHTTRMAWAGFITAAGLALTGCGGDDPEGAGTDVEDVVEGDVAESSPAPQQTEETTEAAEPGAGPYVGPYNRDFSEQVTAYDGQEVTLSAEVAEVFSTESPTAFTVSDPDDVELGDLLVISKTAMPEAVDGETVEVMGTIRTDFQLSQVEEDVAADLEDEWFQDFEGDPYVEATEIKTGEM